MLPFGIERIGDHSARNAIPRFVSTADRNHRNIREATAHDREELESRHLRHVEIGDNDVWGGGSSELQKRVKAIFCGTDVVFRRFQEPCQTLANARLVVNNKDSVLRCVARGQARPFLLVGTSTVHEHPALSTPAFRHGEPFDCRQRTLALACYHHEPRFVRCLVILRILGSTCVAG